MWEARNGIVTGNEDSVKAIQTHQDIKQEFEQGSQGLPRKVKALFSRGLRAMLKQPLGMQQAWLIQIKSAYARQERRAKTNRADTYQSEHQGMARWLGLADPSAHTSSTT